jgi:hypothetical protein
MFVASGGASAGELRCCHLGKLCNRAVVVTQCNPELTPLLTYPKCFGVGFADTKLLDALGVLERGSQAIFLAPPKLICFFSAMGGSQPMSLPHARRGNHSRAGRRPTLQGN